MDESVRRALQGKTRKRVEDSDDNDDEFSSPDLPDSRQSPAKAISPVTRKPGDVFDMLLRKKNGSLGLNVTVCFTSASQYLL